MADIPVKFIITVVRPDQRTYRQQEVELVCQQEMQVLVPLNHEMVANSEDVIQAKLGSGNVAAPNPILTVAGLKYVIDQFDNVFMKVDEKPDQPQKFEEDDWGEEETKPTEKKSAPAEEEDWEETKEDSKEVPWDADDEKWE